MIPPAELVAELTLLVTTPAPAFGGKLRFFTNSPPVFPANPVAADLVAPTFTGAPAAAAITWGAAFVNPASQAEASGGVFPCVCSATGAPNIITGAAVVDTTDTDLLAIDVFDTPITITNIHDGFSYVLRKTLSGS